MAEGRPLTHTMLLRKRLGPRLRAGDAAAAHAHGPAARQARGRTASRATSIETLTGVGYRLRG